jgi:hypothetical protein
MSAVRSLSRVKQTLSKPHSASPFMGMAVRKFVAIPSRGVSNLAWLALKGTAATAPNLASPDANLNGGLHQWGSPTLHSLM